MVCEILQHARPPSRSWLSANWTTTGGTRLAAAAQTVRSPDLCPIRSSYIVPIASCQCSRSMLEESTFRCNSRGIAVSPQCMFAAGSARNQCAQCGQKCPDPRSKKLPACVPLWCWLSDSNQRPRDCQSVVRTFRRFPRQLAYLLSASCARPILKPACNSKKLTLKWRFYYDDDREIVREGDAARVLFYCCGMDHQLGTVIVAKAIVARDPEIVAGFTAQRRANGTGEKGMKAIIAAQPG
jgi:hypothetical protein